MLSREDNETLGAGSVPGRRWASCSGGFWTPVMLARNSAARTRRRCASTCSARTWSRFATPRNDRPARRLLSAPPREPVLGPQRRARTALRLPRLEVRRRTASAPICPTAPEGVNAQRSREDGAVPDARTRRLVWAYLGPRDVQPEFPDFEGFARPESRGTSRKIIAKGNYLQLKEGDVDSSHVSFLHSRLDNKPLGRAAASMPTRSPTGMPRWFPQETDYGLMLSAQRNAGPGPLPVARQPVSDAVHHADRGAAGTADAAPGARADRRRDLDALPLLHPPRTRAHRRRDRDVYEPA